MSKLSHSELVERAYNWLLNKQRCGFAFKELVTICISGETPDVIGFKGGYSAGGGYSILVECKTSLSDFYADKNKIFRKYPDYGMGNQRYLLTDNELIKIEQVPELHITTGRTRNTSQYKIK